jgi:biotin-dependent carboxylase-like uncharacterized protein
MNALELLRAGPLTTVQDLGRPGWAHLGVPPAGAFDRDALRRGNRLVGNGDAAAGLEATLVAPTIRFTQPALVAVTGARTAFPYDAAVEVEAGDVIALGSCRDGVRSYICVRGGIDVEPVLGSRSHDVLTGLGPPPLRDGDVVRLGGAPAREPGRGDAPARGPTLRVVPGPRDDWFAPDALGVLTGTDWRVGNASNRVGIRLEGPPLRRRDDRELLSEGLVTGAIQVPPSGRPILLGPDHPTTGGYPVVAVVFDDDVSRAGQLGPGAVVRFALTQ